MNLPSTFSIALLLACASSAFAQNSPASKLPGAKAQARNTGKPLMVVFRCDP
jgi:hypothetical protein